MVRWLKVLKQFFFFIVIQRNEANCRIESISLKKQEVVFHIKNKSTFLKCTLADAIGDLSIIENLSPREACWLGGYFGRAIKKKTGKSDAIKKMKAQGFLLKGDKGAYQIAFQNRTGEIGYFDKASKEQFVDSPVALASHDYIVSKFSPSQACYIGILAGIFMEKKLLTKENKVIPFQQPLLRVVK